MDRLSQVPRFPTLFKMQFCLGHFHACARYLVAQKSGPENVPRDLLPVDMDQVLSVQGS
jgi:hypothetical protein